MISQSWENHVLHYLVTCVLSRVKVRFEQAPWRFVTLAAENYSENRSRRKWEAAVLYCAVVFSFYLCFYKTVYSLIFKTVYSVVFSLVFLFFV